MTESLDPYAVLGVDRHADREEIRRAWLEAVKAEHPDRHLDDEVRQALADDRIRSLNRAWSVLGDASRREAFDRSAAASTTATPAAPATSRPRPVTGPPPAPVRSHGGAVIVVGLLVVLASILVLSAYATSNDGGSSTPTGASTTSTIPLVGTCVSIAPSANGLITEAVDCDGPNSGRVTAIVDTPRPCPSGSTARDLSDHRTTLCVVPS